MLLSPDQFSLIQANLQTKQYSGLIDRLEGWIQEKPTCQVYYWYLGLAFLLSHQEEEAQFTWLSTLAEAGDAEEEWLNELVAVIEAEAQRKASFSSLENTQDDVWLLRQHLRSICPTNLSNLLGIIQLAAQQDHWVPETDCVAEAIDLLATCPRNHLNASLALETMGQLLQHAPMHPESANFVRACIPHVPDLNALIHCLFPAAMRIAHSARNPKLAAQLAEAYLEVDPDNQEFLGQLVTFYQDATDYDTGIATAKRYYAAVEGLVKQIFASHLILRGLLNAGGYWEEAIAALQRHQQLLQCLSIDSLQDLASVHVLRLLTSTYFLPYFQDTLDNCQLRHHVVEMAQNQLRALHADTVTRYHQGHQQRRARADRNRPKLKIGYLSHCMGRHSVGWLGRWLIQHHDRDRIGLYGYFINERLGDSLQSWYVEQFDQAYFLDRDFGDSSQRMADQIHQDEIDILVDLDSITLDVTCEILAMKPAPIQVTWLGWDAIGMSAIDYFIADPYVLPENAQAYYTEKLWRLPETYIAVDGFEVGVPTLRRSELEIPEDAMVYLTTQRGYKRHRDTARLQLKIIHGVPNSYLLIKGFADDQAIQKFFYELADEVGVDRDRLRFLPNAASEAVHRANLRIADVVLDTYPYNGATTTLETLWMEVPIVTWVGQQFAARNSYTMMMNAGITEGIAWSAEEYVEWGIKLGTDLDLRKQVVWKLHQSKQSSPLWNGQLFAQEMEKAFAAMWEQFVG
ncbi:O-linked N-acetylglucosamine transferase, SPINDLY family protein [Alkalinema sp. FACHB-956]|uniref:O-linked N-acetylglucosamine transferase, SPINDLY family protein n=1 Tax=Alkalinema sp. FACHB-956 TaxID=2692768 RepID=UPI0016894003|nr:O-linked N-acetylglucosamine transferase, SPINDLY family protein [Alkalinema sp. FACHB-956]MBD2326300.1 O-linked N-acetylglucosamine transferase, SPINDLY family protein [Alkalinema sp. FACHB-956]